VYVVVALCIEGGCCAPPYKTKQIKITDL